MLDCGITTYFLAIIWFFSFLMIIAAINTGHSVGRFPLIVATALSSICRLMPDEYLQEVVNSFKRNFHVIFPVTVMSVLFAIVVGYIYMFSYMCSYRPENLPNNLKESSDSD